MILVLLLTVAAGWVLIFIGAGLGLINGVTVLGIVMVMGAAVIHHLLTSERHHS